MPTPRPYHHGSLKQTLLEASLALIRKSGPGGFTMREVARMAGVSHNAPYRHFRDKEELLAALAAEGFHRLTEAMVKAAESAPSALDRFRRSGRGYVEFALRHPQHFAIMFEFPWRFDLHPLTKQEGERAFGTLVQYLEACQAEQSLPPGDAQQFALVAWSMVHGVAKLALSGRLPWVELKDVLDFNDAAIAALTWGLAKDFTPLP